MNQQPSIGPGSPKRIPSAIIHTAKWPPDDDAPGSMGGGASFVGGGGGDEGNFKKGRFKVIGVVFVFLAIAAGAAIFVIGGTKQAEQLSQKQVADEKKSVALLSLEEAMPRYRKWAAMDEAPKLQEEGFAQLAWNHDPQGVALITKGLESSSHAVRGTAATALLEYGSPAADSAKPALLKALKEADESDRPQIAWALATLPEPSAFDDVMKLYRLGHLAKVQRLDGNPAFDPEQLASMVSLDKLAALAGDDSESVRQLVATA